jgi:nucleotide-binding universal stress UspA family protein
MSYPIVVPLDGSVLAEGAVPHAVAIARRLHAPIQLVRVLGPERSSTRTFGEIPVDALLDHEMNLAADRAFEATAARVRGEGIAVEVVTRYGETVPALAEHVRHVRAALVVMTTHGRTGWRRAVLGSVADGLVRSVDAPVHVVPAPDGVPAPVPAAPVPWLVALEGSERDDTALALADLARRAFDARLRLVHVIEPHERRSSHTTRDDPHTEARDYLDRVAALLGTAESPVATEVVTDEHAATGIRRVADERGLRHVALVTRGARGVEAWLLGSVADRLLRDGRLSLLLVRARG